MKVQEESRVDGVIVAMPSLRVFGRVCLLVWARRVPHRRSRPRSHSWFAFLTFAFKHSFSSNS